MNHNTPVITIDGLASSGKTSISKKLSNKLGYYFLDSGILYRSAAFLALEHNLKSNPIRLIKIFNTQINLVPDNQLRFKIYYENSDITSTLYKEEIGTLASKISQFQEVREHLISLQHSCVKSPGLVVNGRDMGTIVFPNAKLKLFIVADLSIRAKRRFEQLQDTNHKASLKEIEQMLESRDKSDKHRKISPLKAADDAVEIDTSNVNVDTVLDNILELYNI